MENFEKSINVGDHILGIFREKNLDFAFSFLKNGFEQKQAVMLITEQATKEKIRNTLRNQWRIKDIKTLEENHNVILKTPQELFFEDGSFNLKNNLNHWKNWTALSMKEGRVGFRVYADTSAFFDHGFVKELVEFESMLDKKFSFPCVVFCAYTYKDLRGLGKSHFNKLRESHNARWMN